ncbi:uncharacterized protein [Antedon mediterranea]|uniref:uncharacterized protein n=1 Tax=Antedon mediterranea TaxID=105859 RepID=UPI003AF4A957
MNYQKPTRNTTWNDVVLFDNSLGNIDSWWNRDNGSAFDVGSTRVFLTARDESRNEAICEFYISIYDDELPQFTYCPGDIYLSTRENEFDEIAVWNVSTAIDNSGIAPIVRGTNQPGELFGIGISTVTYTATDSFLNNNTCSFKIYVFDNENPQFITCAPEVIIANEFRRDGAVVEWTEPIVWDNSLTDLVVTSSFVSGHYFTLGLTTVEYMAIDNHNNTASCSFNVTVNDTEKPTFQNCPGNFSHPTDYRLPSAVVTWSALVSEDNSGHDPNVTSNYDPGDTFLIGVYEINYWSEDLTGNKVLCSFHLHVFDNESPVFTFCPSNILLNPMFFRPSAVANWSEPTAEDNSHTVELITSNYNSFDVFPIGMTWVIYQAFDRAKNFENCSFSVIVIDIAPPVWHNCSDDVIVTTDYRRPDVNISWHVPTAIDDSGYSPTVVSNYKPGDILLLGLTGVSYMATDNFQNKAECNFTVVVIDEEPPYFIDCPVDFIYFVDDTADYGNPSWLVPNTTDNSGVRPLVTASHQPYDEFPVNTTLVNYTSIDDDYNVGTCQFYITLLHTFNYLLTLNFENITGDEVDLIVEISIIAVENLDGRKLGEEEETTLLLTLDVLLEDNSATPDQESSQSQVVGATLISEALIQPIQKKALAAQLEIISNVEEIFLDRTPDVIVNASFTYESADVAVSMHTLEHGDQRWFHFYKEDSKVQSKDSDSKRIADNGKAFLRLKSDGIGEDESIGLMMSYFDRSVFKSSSSDEIVNYIQPKSGDTTEYQLQSGVLVCKLMGNTKRYSTEVEFAMVVDVMDELIKLVERAICVSWNEKTERWSEDGCRLVSSGLSELVECHCSHTSIFGILLPTELEDDNELFAIMVRVVTYCTGIASIVSLIVVAIIMLRLQKHKLPFDAERVFVMANLIISALLMMLLYVCTLELSDDNITCIVVGVILQYLYIAMVMWIFVDVFNLFTKLYNMKGKNAAKYHFALAWGVSGFFTFLFFGTYRGYEDSEGCWTDMEMGVIAAFATPTLLILLTSTILTLVCLTCKTKLRGKRKENCVMQCRGIMICISLFLPLFLTIWAISVQVSEGDIYQMLFFGGFGLHGAFISGYVYYNFRYVEKARMSSMNVHMVEDDHKEDANDNVNAADNEAIMISASVTTEDGYDEIDRAIENQLTLSPSIHSRALLLSESRQNSMSSLSLKLSNKVSPTTDNKLPREDSILTLPGAVDVPDDIVEEESTELVESDSIEKEPASESSDGKSAKSATSQNKDEEESDSSDEDEESKNESSSDSSESESETEINEKSNDSSEDEDDE